MDLITSNTFLITSKKMCDMSLRKITKSKIKTLINNEKGFHNFVLSNCWLKILSGIKIQNELWYVWLPRRRIICLPKINEILLIVSLIYHSWPSKRRLQKGSNS